MDEFIRNLRGYMTVDNEIRVIVEDFVKFGMIVGVPAALDAYVSKRDIVTRSGLFQLFYVFVAVAVFHLGRRSLNVLAEL